MSQIWQSVKEAIDNYMNENEPLCLGWEAFGFNSAYIHLKRIAAPEKERINIRIKAELQDSYLHFEKLAEDKKREKKLYEYFNTSQMWRIWNERSHCRVPIKTVNLREETMMFFDGEGGKLIEIYAKRKYGTVLNAIDQTEKFVSLWNEFEQWFDERRNKLKDELLSKEQNGEIAKSMNVTNRSHGGVANLLKVLTKTMKEQGADIRSIAKVQYAVCKQAGIYIPDEFITDFATALVIEESEVK